MLPAITKLALCFALAVWLGACGDRRLDRAAGRFEPSTEGVLKVATSEVPSPGFWRGTADDLTGGFEFELAQQFAQQFGLDDLEVVIVPLEEITAGDLDGADMALSLITPTSERDAVLDFSEPYLRSPPALLTDAGQEVPDLETARELTYAVEGGTTLEADLAEAIDPDARVDVLDDQDAVVGALEQGAVDVAMLDLPAAVAIADRSGGDLGVAAKLGSDETIAAALPEGETANAEATSSAIRALTSDGTLAGLSDRWLSAEIIEGAPDVPLLRTSR